MQRHSLSPASLETNISSKVGCRGPCIAHIHYLIPRPSCDTVSVCCSVRRHPPKIPYGWGCSVGLAEVIFQDKTRTPDGVLLLFESMQVSRGSSLLRSQGRFDSAAREAIHVAYDYVRSHMQQIQQALPSTATPQRNLLAPDMDTVINCSPVNLVKKGTSCE